MRFHLAYLGLLLALLGAGGALLASARGGPVFLSGGEVDLAGFLGRFQQAHRPLFEINFSALYGDIGRFEILHPRARLASSRAPDLLARLQDVDAGAKACEPGAAVPGARSAEACRLDRPADPSDPAWHSLAENAAGHSYAFQLVLHGPSYVREKSWVESHLSYFKADELAWVLAAYQIHDPVFNAISRLGAETLEEIRRGAPLALSAQYLLVRDQSRLGFSPLSYRVFDARELRAALARSDYDLVAAEPGAFCLETAGGLCWTYSPRHVVSYLHRYALAAAALVALLFALTLGLYLRRILEKSGESRRQTLALQVLSHEFRTPVSSLLLLLDRLGEHDAGRSAEAQDLVTRASAEAFRLQRVIELSQTYLQARGRKIQFRAVEIASVNEWLAGVAAEAGAELEPLARDCALVADPFWLRFVLASLVQNAHAHGKSPVRVRVRRQRDRLAVSVEDQGECEFDSVREMTDAFVKSARSQGMGLGLNIVKLVVEDWGSELRFSKSPTVFSLTVGETR